MPHAVAVVRKLREQWFYDHLYQGSSDEIQSTEVIAAIERANDERRQRFDAQTQRILNGESSMLFPTHPDQVGE